MKSKILSLSVASLIAAEEVNPGPYMRTVLDKCNDTVPGFADAELLQTGNFDLGVVPFTTFFADSFSSVVMAHAWQLTGLPSRVILGGAQERHEKKLDQFRWFGAMPGTLLKMSTDGDRNVISTDGGYEAVMGGAGNTVFRDSSEAYVAVREENGVMLFRGMPHPPYSQVPGRAVMDDKGFLDEGSRTDCNRMLYAIRDWMLHVSESGLAGKIVVKPTIAIYAAVYIGIATQMMKMAPGFEVTQPFEKDFYKAQKKRVDLVMSLAPEGFFDCIKSCKGKIECFIADDGYIKVLIRTLIRKGKCSILTDDLDGDRLADVNNGFPSIMGELIDIIKAHPEVVIPKPGMQILADLGYDFGGGYDSTSIVRRMHGPEMLEMTLGTGQKMIIRFRAGKELDGGKLAYDPSIAYRLLVEAFRMSDPDNEALHTYNERNLQISREVYEAHKADGFLRICEELAARIQSYEEYLGTL